MYVITFYSFKGGVGRTMALVNVAAELVRRGRNVLVVDFDLEAPGLETYNRLRPKEPHPGIVEYVTEFRRTQAVPNLLEFIYEPNPIGLNLMKYTATAKATLGIDLRPGRGNQGGRLWVMPAGRRDEGYRRALTDLDWKRLYEDEGGFLLFEDTKKGWEKELKPDYVLIDSRTGDTDVLGICTRQLPDAVVLMFMPNEQNLVGLKNVVRDIRREETEGLKKKIQTHFVAANVPRLDDEEGILQKRLREFREALNLPSLDLDGVIDRYDSLLHLDQRVFVLERPRSRLAKQYRRLVRRLIIRNVEDREGAMLQLRRYRDEPGALETDLLDLSPESLELDRLRVITLKHCKDQEILVLSADLYFRMGDFAYASFILDKALELDDKPETRLLRSRVRFDLGRKELAVEDLLAVIQSAATSEELLVQAMKHLRSYDSLALQRDVIRERIDALSPVARRQIEHHFIAKPGNTPMDFALDMLLEADPQSLEQAYALHQLSDELLCGRKWSELINASLGWPKSVIRRYKALSLINQALAHWGIDGEMPKHLCSQIVKVTHAPSACESHAADCQALALVYWRLGDRARAKEYVQKALVLMKRDETPELSYWRCLKASPKEFYADCRQIDRLIDGEPLQPLFLAGPWSPETGEVNNA